MRKLAQALKSAGYDGRVELVGFFRDPVSRTYQSKKWKLNINELVEIDF